RLMKLPHSSEEGRWLPLSSGSQRLTTPLTILTPVGRQRVLRVWRPAAQQQQACRCVAEGGGAFLAVLGIAPNITKGPLDSTVIDGMSVVLSCETSGAPRPAITWQKGERILASGSVQLPRFTLLESGSLLVSPTHIADAGSYTCLATNSRGVDEASADLVVWARTRITSPPQDQSVIKGTKASMSCGVTHDPRVAVRC
ncbi:protein sidekick-2-like, partial [Chelonoidis abingdonii]|uniref:protein sidekick-2-like n=1 Tax=Chelonoidis abingdonii TaxID=106734 RepID=UPI003F4908C4